MAQIFVHFARMLQASPLHDAAVYLLGNVPGLPPVVQTVHILSIACIAGSVIMVDLRVLGLALPSQDLSEMTHRLMPWTWWSLPMLLLSGSLFVLARPVRYFVNPVFGIKFALLVPAMLLALLFHLKARQHGYWELPGRRASAKIVAATSLLLWLGVAMAGRWIAYADYLFPN